MCRKILLATLFLLLGATQLWAERKQSLKENSLVVKLVDGSSQTFHFDSDLKMEYHKLNESGYSLLIHNSLQDFEIPISELSTLSFHSESTVGVTPIVNDADVTINANSIEIANASGKVYVYDMSGRVVFTSRTNHSVTHISTDHLAKGTYILKVNSSTYKFIKRK